MTTEPLPQNPGTTPPRSGPSRLTIALAIVAGALLLALVAIVAFVVGRGPGTPEAGDSPGPTASTTPAPTDSESPTPEPTTAAPPPPPTDTSTRFTSFTADLTVECDPTGQQDKPEITFSWTASNALEAWYTPSTKDAKDDDYMRFPNANAGTQNDLTDEHLFPCNHDRYLDVTITLVGPNGEHVSRHVVYEDVNWQ